MNAKQKKDMIHLENLRLEWIGKKINGLEVLDLYFVPVEKDKVVTWSKIKCTCGKEYNSRFASIKAGQSRSCGHSKRKNVSAWQEAIKDARGEGTNIVMLTREKPIKSNTSGYAGVSWSKQKKKWRAYINFKSKQYHLGFYGRAEEASKAYQTARKELHGEFLDWYEKEYPDNWKRICKKMKSTD